MAIARNIEQLFSREHSIYVNANNLNIAARVEFNKRNAEFNNYNKRNFGSVERVVAYADEKNISISEAEQVRYEDWLVRAMVKCKNYEIELNLIEDAKQQNKQL